MIIHIAKQWLISLTFLLPNNILTGMVKTVTHFARSLTYFLFHFWWLISIEVFLLAATGTTINKAFSHYIQHQKALSAGVSFTMSLVGCIAHIITMLLFIYLTRKKANAITINELPSFILRYVQLTILLLAIRFFVIATLFYFGIRIFPALHTSIIISAQIIETILFIAWLEDSNNNLRSISSLFEQIINLYFYNLPFFILIGLLIILTQSGINTLLCSDINLPVASLNKHPLFLFDLEKEIPLLSGYLLIALRYIYLLLYSLIIAGFYQWYIDKKSDRYSKHYFSEE